VFNKQQVISQYILFCKLSQLPPEKVILSAGGALVLLGLLEKTADLDLDVPVAFYNKVKRDYGICYLKEGDCYRWDETVDIKPSLDIPSFCSEGVYCYTISELIKQKEYLLTLDTRPGIKKIQDKIDLMKLKKEEVGGLLDVKRIVRDSYKNTKKIANNSFSGAHRLSPAEKQNINNKESINNSYQNNGKWANDGQSLIGKVNEIMNRDMGLFGKINQELPPVCVDIPSNFFEDEHIKSLMLGLAQSKSFAFKSNPDFCFQRSYVPGDISKKENLFSENCRVFTVDSHQPGEKRFSVKRSKIVLPPKPKTKPSKLLTFLVKRT